MTAATLIAYYSEGQAAREAIQGLGKAGYRRVAGMARAADGTVRAFGPFLRRRVLGAVAAFALFATLALAALGGLYPPGAMVPSFAQLPALAPAGPAPALLASGTVGVLLSLVWIRRSRYGVEAQILRDHAGRIVAGETVVILRAPTDGLQTAVTCLLECGESPPAVFVLHPERQAPTVASRNAISDKAPLSGAPLTDHARRLAAQHKLDEKPLRNGSLLSSLERERRWIQQVCTDLDSAVHLEQTVPASAEWLLDNEYILESNARDVRLNLPWAYYRQLPALASGPDRGLPRAYGLVRELATRSELFVDTENMLHFVEAYQATMPLSIGELWALPQMIKTVLIEAIGVLAGRALTELRELQAAAFWANRLITTNRSDANRFFAAMVDLTEAQPEPSPYFASQLIEYLHGEGPVLAPVQGWLERAFEKPLQDLIQDVKSRQTKDQVTIGNAFTSLRRLALLDWKHSFEHLSRVEQTLRRDPAGVYAGMDFATRDRYRRAVEELGRGSGRAEDRVAELAVEMARSARLAAPTDMPVSHVGTYLIGDKRAELARSIGSRETLRFRASHWAHRHHSAVFFLGLAFFAGLLTALVVGLGVRTHGVAVQLIFVVLVLIPVSQLAVEIMNALVMRVFPPRVLAKMDFKETGIPAAYRTLVVVPMMLGDEGSNQCRGGEARGPVPSEYRC